MARPARPAIEADVVRQAAVEFRGTSIRAVAASIARRVVGKLLAYIDLDTTEPVIALLAEARRRQPDGPYDVLAMCPEVDLASLVYERRLTRFRARGCRQLSPEGWRQETTAIAAEIEATLTSRYARLLRSKKCA